jgi:nucleoid-associated protein YgaU
MATLTGGRALLGTRDEAATEAAEANWQNRLQAMRQELRSQVNRSVSVVPRQIRLPLLNSTAVLFCYRAQVGVAEAVASLGRGAAVAALIAAERARSASWGTAAVQYCEAVAAGSEAQGTEYIVQPGDTLSRIVRRHFEMAFDRLWPLIRALNPRLSDPNLIFAGQKILLPSLEDLNVDNQG